MPNLKVMVLSPSHNYTFMDKQYKSGENVSVSVPSDIGEYRFKEWREQGKPARIAYDLGCNAYSKDISFTIFGEDITLTAVYENVYTLRVNNGIGDDSYFADHEVTITALTAPNGYKFKCWQSPTDLKSNNNKYVNGCKDETVKFNMPAESVTVVAEYEPIVVVSRDTENTVATIGAAGDVLSDIPVLGEITSCVGNGAGIGSNALGISNDLKDQTMTDAEKAKAIAEKRAKILELTKKILGCSELSLNLNSAILKAGIPAVSGFPVIGTWTHEVILQRWPSSHITIKTSDGQIIKLNDSKSDREIVVSTRSSPGGMGQINLRNTHNAVGGHYIKLQDNDKHDNIIIETKKGRKIVLDDKENKITISGADDKNKIFIEDNKDNKGCITVSTKDNDNKVILDGKDGITLKNKVGETENSIVLDEKGITLRTNKKVNIESGEKDPIDITSGKGMKITSKSSSIAILTNNGNITIDSKGGNKNVKINGVKSAT